jgi:hypothetical protein
MPGLGYVNVPGPEPRVTCPSKVPVPICSSAGHGILRLINIDRRWQNDAEKDGRGHWHSDVTRSSCALTVT